jgi:hypothetical protein
MPKRKDPTAASSPAKKQRADTAVQQKQQQQQQQQQEQQQRQHSKGFKNKEKVLVLGTRGITYRYVVCVDCVEGTTV